MVLDTGNQLCRMAADAEHSESKSEQSEAYADNSGLWPRTSSLIILNLKLEATKLPAVVPESAASCAGAS